MNNTLHGTGCPGNMSEYDPSVDDGYHVMEVSVHSVQLILGLPVSVYALWLILSGAGGTVASEFFYLNLVSSVLVGVLTSLFYFSRVYHAAHTVYTATIILYFVSLLSFQCCVCVERYVAVVHPVMFLRYKALRYRVSCCCSVWLAAFPFSAVSAVYYKSCSTMLTVCCVLLGFYTACISLVSFCCFSVLRALKQPGPGEGQRDQGEGNTLKRRAFRVILVSLVLMVVTVLLCITNMLRPLLVHTDWSVYGYVTYALAAMSGFLHPLVYIHKVGKMPCFKGL